MSDALIVAGCTAVSYLYAIEYERGLLGYYGIPSEIIDIGLTTVIGTASIVIAAVCTAGAFVLSATLILPKTLFPVGRIAAAMPMVVMAAVRIWAYEDWRAWIVSAILAGFLCILFFGLPLLTQKGKGSYINKLAEQDKVDTRDLERRAIDVLLGPIGPKTYFLGYWLLIGYFVCSSLGEGMARRQSQYAVIGTSPEAVVVRVYGDRALCVPFERAKKQFGKSSSLSNLLETIDSF